MTEQEAAPPKRTAMQVALNAEQAAAELREELENLSALAAAGVEGGGGAVVGVAAFDALRTAVDETRNSLIALRGQAIADMDTLRKELANIVGLIPGDLWAGEGGALATQQQVAALREQVGELAYWRDATKPYTDKLRNLQATVGDIAAWREGLGGHLPSGEADQILTQLERRVSESLAQTRQQVAELHQDVNTDSTALGNLAETVAELKADVERLRSVPMPMGIAAGAVPPVSAPHVLGLIVALKKQIGAISKDRRTEHKGGKYDFRGVDDAINAVGNACDVVGIVPPRATVVDHRTTLTPMDDGRVWTSSVVVMRYTFQSPIDGSEWSTEGIGEGRDLADKSFTKAQAGAYKYAMFHGLSIVIEGMNVDAETEHPVMDGRPADQGSHQYRQWENRQERAEQAEYAEQARAQQPPADTRTPDEQAMAALKAARSAPDLATVNKVWDRADQLDILDVVVDGGDGARTALRNHLIVAAKTAPRGPAVTQ